MITFIITSTLLAALGCLNVYVGVREIRLGVASLRHGDRVVHAYSRDTEPAKFWAMILLVRFVPILLAIYFVTKMLAPR